ncbi:Protein kinase domain containing protein [Musa troglodytarum]|uniref:Protein kinase domain containing protein n=1 Tax=Musa troglodytarum TaxID=320322 RepID=A0A9E7JP89_9LILI|nr:Protein kinase domain containing protein [Musa troglodytarum]
MSRMKHLLRKLHIGGGGGGGGVDHQHHQRLGDPRRNPSPPPAASASSAGPQEAASAGPQEAASAGPDFRLFEEEYQVQLALAISASDPDGLEDPDSVQMKAAKRMSLGCSLGVGTAAADSVGVGGADESSMEFLSLRYWVSLEVFPSYNVVNYDEKLKDGFYDPEWMAPERIPKRLSAAEKAFWLCEVQLQN